MKIIKSKLNGIFKVNKPPHNTNLRKKYQFYLLFFFGLIFTGLLCLTCNSKKIESSLPVIEQVNRQNVTIFWETTVSHKGEISYFAEGKAEKQLSEKKASRQHRLQIQGLLPGKVYFYRLNSLPEKEFSFRTAPQKTASFRFCLLSNPDFSTKSIRELYPDFIIFNSNDSTEWITSSEKFAQLRTRIPIFTPPFNFQWANSYFQTPTTKSDLDESTESGLQSDDLGLPIQFIFPFKNTQFQPSPDRSDSGQCILFFESPQAEFKVIEKMGIKHVTPFPTPLLVEVQGLDIRAFPITDSENDTPVVTGLKEAIEINQATLDYQKTCVYCRRLLEDKRYRASIKWYRLFIAENSDKNRLKTQARLDDAYYQIAYIYDHYLFEYTAALTAYQKLLDKYPASQWARPANFRIQYIQAHTDHNFVPLRVFEKARLTQLREKGFKIAIEVENTLNQYPETSLKAEILFWLANIYQQQQPQKAKRFYQILADSSMDIELKFKATVGIGDIYYAQAEYVQAEKVYQSLLESFPKKAKLIQPKIKRCLRNRQREWIRNSAFGIILLFLLFTLGLSPRGFYTVGLKPILVIFLTYLAVTVIPLLIWYDYLQSLISYIAIAVPVLSLCGILLVVFNHKLVLFKMAALPRIILLNLVNLVVTAALLYVLFFYFHYLIVIERLF